VSKFRLATPLNSEVLSDHLLHFKPILDPFLKKIVRGTEVPGGGSDSKTWSFYGACKNLEVQHSLGAKIWSSEKVDLGGYDSTSRSPYLVDQSSPDLFRLTREESR